MAGVLRRTVTGTALALVAALLIALDGQAPPGLVPWAASTGIVLLIVFELSRMGSLVGRGLAFSLGVPAVAMGMVSLAVAVGDYGWPAELRPVGLLAVGYLAAPLIACAAHGGERVVRRSLGLRRGWIWALVPAGLWVGALLAFGPTGAAWTREAPWRAGGLLALLALLPAFLLLRDVRERADLRLTCGLAAWSIPPLPGWILLAASGGVPALVALVVLSKVGDVAGYFVGRSIGRTHPFPKLSPGKTTAGCVASTVAAALVGAGLVAGGVIGGGSLGLLGGALAGLLINLAAQAGDLTESWVKRRAGVKDSSTLCGAAGGVLDVVDSFLVTVPVALALWPWLLVPGD